MSNQIIILSFLKSRILTFLRLGWRASIFLGCSATLTHNCILPQANAAHELQQLKVAMESQPNLKFLGILENISHYFDFLSSRGFRMVSVIFSDHEYENWQVTMMTDDYIIKVYRYGGKVDSALNTLQLYKSVGLFALDDLIYWVNGNKDLLDPLEEVSTNERQSFERLAWRLEKHIDSILSRIRKVRVLRSIDHPSITLNTLGHMFQNN